MTAKLAYSTWYASFYLFICYINCFADHVVFAQLPVSTA